MQTLRDLPDIEALEDAGLLSRNEMRGNALAQTAGDEE
jgi:segregation and condensation protein B